MTEPIVEELAKFEAKGYRVWLTKFQESGSGFVYQIHEAIDCRPTMCSSHEDFYRAVLLFNDLVSLRMQALVREWEKK